MSSKIRLKSEAACKSSDDLKSVERSSAIKSSKSLSVPSIYVDSVDTESEFSSRLDISEPPSRNSLADIETVSMIVRNVNAMEALKDSDEMEEIELPKDESEAETTTKVGSPKKHDIMHDLKDSIQEKFHHLSDSIKKHKKESPPLDKNAKPKEKFHDLKENVSGKIHQIAEKMHHFHMPHLPHHHQAEGGLISQAMQTILMEKFNIAEASTAVGAHSSEETNQRRKSSSPSLKSIKEKFNSFQRPRRSVEQSETSSLKSISEVNSPSYSERTSGDFSEFDMDESSVVELKIRTSSETSNDSVITVLSCEDKPVLKDDLRVSVDNFDSFLSTHQPFSKVDSLAETNKKPLHASLLSLTRNDLLSTSPSVLKTHARTESIGCKSASPSKNVSSSLGKDQMTTGIHRRSSDSDLSITPKGELKI